MLIEIPSVLLIVSEQYPSQESQFSVFLKKAWWKSEKGPRNGHLDHWNIGPPDEGQKRCEFQLRCSLQSDDTPITCLTESTKNNKILNQIPYNYPSIPIKSPIKIHASLLGS